MENPGNDKKKVSHAMKWDWKRYFSRKFIVAHEITLLLSGLPILFTKLGVEPSVQMIALGGIVGIGTAYGILNIKDKGQ